MATRADWLRGSKRAGKRPGRKPISDPARIPAVRRRLLHRLPLPNHQCGPGVPTGSRIGARCRRSRLADVSLLSDVRCRPDTDWHIAGPIRSAADPECIAAHRGWRFRTLRGVGPFLAASGGPRTDRSGCRICFDGGIEGACSLVSWGSCAASQWLDGHAGRARCGDRDVARRLFARLDRLARTLWSFRSANFRLCGHDLSRRARGGTG